MSLAETLAQLGNAPDLRGASCVAARETFDEAVSLDNLALAAALQMCAQCPVLVACGAWLDGLPKDQRPAGGRWACHP